MHEYLQKIEQGKISKEEALKQIKNLDESLYTLLKKALLLQELQNEVLRTEYKQASKTRIYYHIMKDVEAQRAAERAAQRAAELAAQKPKPKIFSYFSLPKLQPFLVAAMVLLISFSMAVGVASAADGAAPGDFLYPIDRGLENIRLAFTFDEMAKVKLLVSHSSERIAEADHLFQEGDSENGNQALAEYELDMQAISDIISQADEEQQAALLDSVSASTASNTQVLNDLLDKLPPSAKDAIEHAIDVSDHTDNPNKPSSPPGLEDEDDDQSDDDVADQDKDNPSDEVLESVEEAKATKEAEKEDAKETKEADKVEKKEEVDN